MTLYCPSVLRYPSAASIGGVFATSFAGQSKGAGKGEVGLFRAMERALVSVATHPGVVVEEYHGTSHQVRFAGNGTFSRTNARCELSDLAVLVYDNVHFSDARLTYIQAKSERKTSASTQGIAGSLLDANLEQWDLLSGRPQVQGVGRFQPPPDLLKNARLASVGSFAFFLHGSSNVEIYYAAASALIRPPRYKRRYGRLEAVADACTCSPYPECLSAYGAAAFGTFLFGLMIGTPILPDAAAGPDATQQWLGRTLRAYSARAGRGNSGTANLARILDPTDEAVAEEAFAEPNIGAPTLLVIGVGSPDRRAD